VNTLHLSIILAWVFTWNTIFQNNQYIVAE